jgi:hypothetical protein
MAYVEVDIDIDEFDTSDLVDELVKRMKCQNTKKSLTQKQKDELKETLSELNKVLSLAPVNGIEIKTLDDKIKFEHIANVFNRYSIYQLEQLLS